jgi:6-pyruvoyltetrahydropterin/6-carboxytetrahydropterin synthase
MRGLGRHYELEVTCRGQSDAITGYFINIREIDQAVRSAAVPLIERACRENAGIDPAVLLPELIGPIDAALAKGTAGKAGVVARIRWRLTPYYSVEMAAPATSSQSESSIAAAPMALLRQQFEFAASHRLHSAHLTDEQNRAIYGKCNLPSGHGHNYRVEPCVAVPIPLMGVKSLAFALHDLERITNERIIQRFDHKHLNLDTKEFTCQDGVSALNPSVENIARVCYDLLEPAIRESGTGAVLRSITVWETDKTSCTFPG